MAADVERFDRDRAVDPKLVHCAHCGGLIKADLTRCPRCGTWFEGEARDFLYEPIDAPRDASPSRMRTFFFAFLAAVLAILALVWAAA